MSEFIELINFFGQEDLSTVLFRPLTFSDVTYTSKVVFNHINLLHDRILSEDVFKVNAIKSNE